ncbi:MAG: radical SAM protein [Candidatus Micrarchaeota archaeon]
MKQMNGSILIPQKGGLGARHLSSALEKETGRPPKLYFLNKVPAHSLYDEAELAAIKTAVEKDDWIGISVAAIGVERARQLIRLLKSTPELAAKPVLVGGVQAFASPQLFYEMGADAVCHQEGEIWLPEAIRMLEAGQRIPPEFETATPRHDSIQPPDYDFTKGMHYVLRGGAIHQIDRPEEEFAAIDNFSIIGPRYPLWLFTDRRCRFSCAYCINHRLNAFDKTHGGPPGRLSTPKLLEWVKEMVTKYPLIDYVVFFDDDFLPRFLDGKRAGKDELGLFCAFWKSEIRRPFFAYFSPMTFVFNGELVGALIDAGLKQVNFGYQSGGREALRHYRRLGTSFEAIRHMAEFTAKAAREGRIDTPAIDFIINSPFETAEDMRQTIETILRLTPPFDTQMHNLHLFVGYRLTKTFEELGTGLNALPGYRQILDSEFQDHTRHAEWLWPNIEDDRAYLTLLQMLMTGLCTEQMLGVLRREDMPMWLGLAPEERRARIGELQALFKANPRIKYYDELAGIS